MNKILKNTLKVVVLLFFIVGVDLFSTVIHELSHVRDVNNHGGEFIDICLYMLPVTRDGGINIEGGHVFWLDNPDDPIDIFGGEIKAYTIGFLLYLFFIPIVIYILWFSDKKKEEEQWHKVPTFKKY